MDANSAQVDRSKYAFEMINIHKSFNNGRIKANIGINLSVEKNSIHAIIGENGAGKSTLMSILFGLYEQDEGEIYINGEKVKFSSSKDAAKYNIGMVHQHFKLIDNYTVIDNIILGSEDTQYGFLTRSKARKKLKELIKTYGFNLNLDQKVSNLTVGQQQKVEILKVLYRQSEILIFDEPTAVLSDNEIASFLNILKTFRENGKTIVIISHKLHEIKEIADCATVIRKGEYIDTINVKDSSIELMAELMVGKKVVETKNTGTVESNENIIEIKNLDLTYVHGVERFFNDLEHKFRNIKNNAKNLFDNITEKISNSKNPKVIQAKEAREAAKDAVSKAKKDLNESKKNKNSLEEIRAKSTIKVEAIKSEKNAKKEVKKAKKIAKQEAKETINVVNETKQTKEIIKETKKNKDNKLDPRILANTFNVRAGEIFAIAGVEGNGQSEIAEYISGIKLSKKGTIIFLGKDISQLSIQKRIDLGMSHVPEDRHKYGLTLDQSCRKNTVNNLISKSPFSQLGFIIEFQIDQYANDIIEKFDVRGTANGTAMARALSGGNQQKLVVGREITKKHKLLLMVQPVRGLDIGAIQYIHERAIEEKNKGNAIILISYELDEILALADTIAVISRNSILEIGPREQMTRQRIGELLAR